MARGGATDVEIDESVPVGVLRRHLARLTGDPEWRSGPLLADGVALPDDHPAGVAPLCRGATLHAGSAPLPEAVRAAGAPWHVAVLAGPDTGRLLVPETPASLGPGGELALVDDEPWTVLVRPTRPRRRGHRRRGSAAPGSAGDLARHRAEVLVRRTTSPAVLVSARGRRRRVPRWRWTAWPTGSRLLAGSSALVVRRAGARDAPDHATGAFVARARLVRWARFAPVVAGVTTSAALAASMHQPVLLLGALSALVLVAPRAEPPPPAAPASGPDEPADLPALRVALAAGASAVTAACAWQGDLVVVGPRRAALGAARALVLSALAEDPRTVVDLRTDRPGDWSWLVWCAAADAPCATGRPGGAARGAPAPRLTIVDGPPGEGRVGASSGRVLQIGGRRPPPPATVLEVGAAPRQERGQERRRDLGRDRAAAAAGVGADVADATARALARRRDDTGATACPREVTLGDLPGVPPPDARAVAAAWRRGGTAVVLGSRADGSAVVVDLVRDGPHGLVAGTTGSGKSELLTTFVLGLALTQPPDRLALLLVDFKGGTGLAPVLATLPHVVGHLSDLDASAARRTLRGLAAELRRRERILAAHGARDVAELTPGVGDTPPRLVVVVDEFRALADELPELVPTWARLAAQGRSLGVHLLLATQRPAGAVTADLRANVALRLVLRVADDVDSADLVGSPDAASFDRPGLALLARGAAPCETLQVARACHRGERAPVRFAPPWPAPSSQRWVPGPPGPPEASDARDDDGPAPWVAAIRRAAAGLPRAVGPWLPPLPTRVEVRDVPDGPGLPLALADLPDELARGAVRWDPEAGHLLVLGGPGSGRSTALATVARAALAEGRPVHTVGLPPGHLPAGVASALGVDDPTRVARLLRLLDVGPPPTPRPLLVVDDVAAVAAALAPLARGAALERLERMWSAARGPAAVAAAGAAGPTTQRLAPCFADRLVLGPGEPTSDLIAGVPPALAGARAQPGRAVHLGRHGGVLCQVALPATDLPRPTPDARPDGCAVRVRPLPPRVTDPLPPPVPARDGRGPIVALGLGGDDASPVVADLARPLLVVGPRGSGRTGALELLAAGAGAVGVPVVRPRGPDDLGPDDALLLVDDLDELESRDHALYDVLGACVAGRRLVAATTTAHAVSAFRGPVPALVRAGHLLVLDVTEPGAAELLGPDGAWLVEGHRQPVGRGVLRRGRELVPLQVAG